MKSQTALILGGMGIIGFLIYKLTIKNEGNLTYSQAQTPYYPGNLSYQAASQGGAAQGSVYPVTPIVSPRVDGGSTANQPWSASTNMNGIAQSLGGLDTNFQQNLQYLSGLSSGLESLDSIWGTVSSWFDDGGTDIYGGFDWGSSYDSAADWWV